MTAPARRLLSLAEIRQKLCDLLDVRYGSIAESVAQNLREAASRNLPAARYSFRSLAASGQEQTGKPMHEQASAELSASQLKVVMQDNGKEHDHCDEDVYQDHWPVFQNGQPQFAC